MTAIALIGFLMVNQASEPARQSNIPYEAQQTKAAAALITQGIDLLVAKQKAPVGFIEGKCRLRAASDSNIFLPCQNVVVVLLNSKGEEVSRSNTNEGSFSFSAKKNEKYQLKVASKAFQLSKEAVGTLRERDIVSLELTPITR